MDPLSAPGYEWVTGFRASARSSLRSVLASSSVSSSPMTAMLSPAGAGGGGVLRRGRKEEADAARRTSNDVEAEHDLFDAGVEGEDALVALVEDDVCNLRATGTRRRRPRSRGVAEPRPTSDAASAPGRSHGAGRRYCARRT